MYETQRGLCAWCQKPMTLEEATEDHATPHTRGGTNTADNIELFHRACNSKKGKKDAGDPGKWPHKRSWDVQSVINETERRSQHRGLGEHRRAEDAVRWAESVGLVVVPGGSNQTGSLDFVLERGTSRVVIMQLWGSSILQLHFPRLVGVLESQPAALVLRLATDVPALGTRRGFQKALQQPGANSPEAELSLLVPDEAWSAFTSAWTDVVDAIRASQ
jgi:hypothetical protein